MLNPEHLSGLAVRAWGDDEGLGHSFLALKMAYVVHL
jgi:hypothetical protein